jgi:hypothetical protein
LKASEAIQNRLLLFGAEWKALSRDFWGSSGLAWRFPELLKISYQVIRASTDLLELARDQSLLRASVDPLAAMLAPYLAQHVEEERDHDKWLMQDLEALGISGETLEKEVSSPYVASMVGAQHYWVRYGHPVSILGYIAVLEGEPPPEAFFSEIAERTGIPESAFRTLRYHSRVDRAHWQDLLDLFDRLPLTHDHLSLIGLSILHTCNGMSSTLRKALDMQPLVPLEPSGAVQFSQ